MKTKNLHKYRPTKITTCLVSFNLLQNEFNSCIASNKSKLEHYGYGSSSFHFGGSLVIGSPGGTLDVDFPLPFGLFPAVDCFVSAFAAVTVNDHLSLDVSKRQNLIKLDILRLLPEKNSKTSFRNPSMMK
uniref:Uncharacterized protein n=1 Tax=Glossina pallidipes TaxID=7398 RepID=A0A1B0AB33_GLOPL